MNTWGLILMGGSWTIVAFTTVYCAWRLLTIKDDRKEDGK